MPPAIASIRRSGRRRLLWRRAWQAVGFVLVVAVGMGVVR